MEAVQQYITVRQQRFSEHAFFERLEGARTFESVMSFAPGLAFWVMAFQDILRLNEQRVETAALRAIVRRHRAEDAGHDQWYLADLAKLGEPSRDLRWVFGPHHAATRDATYALMSEVFRAADDRLRVVLLLVIESAGHVFFERVARSVAASGTHVPLRYFAGSHLEVEHGHDLFTDQTDETLRALEMTPELQLEAEALIDRVYDAFERMFDGLGASAASRHPSGTISSVRPPSADAPKGTGARRVG